MDFKDNTLTEIDNKLCSLMYLRYNYGWLTPINISDEFRRFQFENNRYNPQFKYQDIQVDNEIKALEDMKDKPNNRFEQLFETIRENILFEARALKNLGSNTFNTTILFGKVDNTTVHKAQDILSTKAPEKKSKKKTITSQELGLELQKSLKKLGLKGWKISYNESLLTGSSISSGTKTIRIKKGAYFSKERVKKLIYHEIGTHVIRAENGFSQKYKIFGHGLPQYLPTEEGLAGYNERKQGIANQEKQYALRALATKIASEDSFLEVFKTIRPFIQSEYKTFLLSARVKRGLGDTSQPGGYLKDHAYLKGKLLLDEFVRKKGSINDLYSGKIGVKDVWLVKQGYLTKPRIIPEFL
ncbi:MAG: tyrosine/phenylalanine carboxypeptidase domain-containing protein [Nanobdellota archaeon]